MFADLECDLVSPVEMCSKLNPVLSSNYSLYCLNMFYMLFSLVYFS